MSEQKGIFNSIDEFCNYYGEEKADRILEDFNGHMLLDSGACAIFKNDDNEYTEKEEADFISVVGEEIAQRLKREQPENYPIIVSHWRFMKGSDVIR